MVVCMEAEPMPHEPDRLWSARQYRRRKVRWNVKLPEKLLLMHYAKVAKFQAFYQFVGEKARVGGLDHCNGIGFIDAAVSACDVADEVEEDHRHHKGPKQCLPASQQMLQIAQ